MMRRCNSSKIFGTAATRLGVAAIVCGSLVLVMGQSAQAGILEGINHTHWAINKFSVDGRSGLDTIGPWQGGGGGHYSVPGHWYPGLTVSVSWETGIAFSDDVPGFEDWPKYLEWEKRIDSQKRQHTRLVPVPEYTAESTCGLTVHFFPCEEIQVTTSCHRYGSPEYPIKTPLELPEPQSCPLAGGASAPGGEG